MDISSQEQNLLRTVRRGFPVWNYRDQHAKFDGESQRLLQYERVRHEQETEICFHDQRINLNVRNSPLREKQLVRHREGVATDVLCVCE